MSKYCGNCGAEADENARVCGKCGVPFEEGISTVPYVKKDNGQLKQKGAKIIKRVIVIAIIVIAALVTLYIVNNYTGVKGFVRKVADAYLKEDVNALISNSSEIYYQSGENGNDNQLEEQYGSMIDESISNFAASVGHNYKTSYEIGEIYDLSSRKTDQLLSDYLYMDLNQIDRSAISEVKVAYVDLTAKQGDESYTVNASFILSKEHGKWKLLRVFPYKY